MTVVKRDLYNINVDNELNRLYINCLGIWNNISDIPELAGDIEKALQYLEYGFTCCTDMSRLKEASADCYAQLSYNKMILLEKGITKDAFIVKHDEALIINFNADSTRMVGKTFKTLSEAQVWLAS